jgi:cytochrome b6-f complex iron-sulfur subunit
VSPATIALIVIAISVAAWALFMANMTIRRGRKLASAPGGAPPVEHTSRAAAGGVHAEAAETHATTAPADRAEVTVEKVPEKRRKPLTPDQLAVSRRQFLNRAWNASFLTFLGLFGMSSLSFLWPKLTGGFGTKITAGSYDDIIKEVGPENGYIPKFVAEGRFWLTYYDGTGDAPVYAATGAVDAKMQALYRKCVHLGCSVPHCDKSMLFECPCHGSKYRLTGEYYGGPAPRGLDRFPITIEGGKVVVDTGDLQIGPPRGTNTWEKFAEPVGSFCVPT